MIKNTKEIIISNGRTLFALHGYEGFTMRILAVESGVGLSSIYHFFADKDVLLHCIFDDASKELGAERYKLVKRHTASQMLYDRIMFQFTHIEKVIFVQKYYLHFRKEFLQTESGFTPTKAYLHIEEVIRFGIKKGQLECAENAIDREAKVMTHAINGFLLEYYPCTPTKSELKKVTTTIHTFMMRSLSNKEVVMK